MLKKYIFLVLQLYVEIFELMSHLVFLLILVWLYSYIWLKVHRLWILNLFFVNLVLYIFLNSVKIFENSISISSVCIWYFLWFGFGDAMSIVNIPYMMWYYRYLWDSGQGFVIILLIQEILVYMGCFLFRIDLQLRCNKIVLDLGRDHYVVLWKMGVSSYRRNFRCTRSCFIL